MLAWVGMLFGSTPWGELPDVDKRRPSTGFSTVVQWFAHWFAGGPDRFYRGNHQEGDGAFR